ncbi:hypothetical protein T484DRAFT_1925166 [Baffinella frigidus]|nr:hypothetical protein T484DRAFT_1925166 [Cryptophyta sp. CCMP2293]
MRVRWLLAFTLTASLAAGGGALGAAPASANWGSGFRQPSTCLGEAGMVGPHVLEGQWGGTMRLRGGAQGKYIDVAKKIQRRANDAMRGENRQLFQDMMNLTLFPATLEPTRMVESHVVTDEEMMDIFSGAQLIEPTKVLEKVVYNAVGGEMAAYRGLGLAGMAVEQPRKWPYAVPETTGHRSWKHHAVINGVDIRKRPRMAACKVSLSTTWQHKMEQKEKRAILRGVVANLRDKAKLAKQHERIKLQTRRTLKLRNRMDSQGYQIITNPAKIARLTAKQKKALKQVRALPGRRLGHGSTAPAQAAIKGKKSSHPRSLGVGKGGFGGSGGLIQQGRAATGNTRGL